MSTTLSERDTHATPEAFGDGTVPIPVPDADSLVVRMGAEWASGVRGTKMWFGYDGALHRSPAPTTLGPVMTTCDVPGRLRLGSVSFSLPGVEDSVVISGSEFDALFWSESAVEKFLFPYYASVKGWEAARFLQDVTKAFYEYSAAKVQVVALAHHCGPAVPAAEVPLTAQRTLHVVFSRLDANGSPGDLEILPLDTVLALDYFGSDQGPAVNGDSPAGTLGAVLLDPGSHDLSSVPFRELAEFASGIRGQYLYLSRDRDLLMVNACPGSTPCAPAGDPVLFTPLRRPDRPVPASVTAVVDGIVVPLQGFDAAVLPSEPDSIFWTDAAVEKFLLPYYASVTGRDSPFTAPMLQAKWDGLVPPDAPLLSASTAVAALEAIGDPAAVRDPDVFAVVHLPRSEYVPESLDTAGATFSVARRTFLLSYDGSTFAASPVSGNAG